MDDTSPSRRALENLRFEVLNDEEDKNPLYRGNYKDVMDYLMHNEREGKVILAFDIDSWSTMDPISAEEFLKWYRLIVRPQIENATYRSDMEIYFPDEHLALREHQF